MSTPTDRVVCNLKSVRRAKGFSQSDLAQLAGVKRQAIYDMESGRYVPNTAVALRLARTPGAAESRTSSRWRKVKSNSR